MQQHNLVQGTPEWHAYRREHFNASDAPAMLGLSKYKTRTQLLNEISSGYAADVDSATQKLFDNGHLFESLARPLAEAIIGEDLSPVTGSNGKLSASFDGLTFMGDIAFEHKTLNDSIRTCNSPNDLDEMYLVQMEQQLLVSGAEKCLFMATSWDKSQQLSGDAVHFWYESNADRRQRIIDGWSQFEKDLETYTATLIAELPKAEVIIDLPALFVHAKGEITTSNMKEYGEALAMRLAEVRKIELITDQDFSNAKQAAKLFREQIKKNVLAEEAMLSQTVTVGEASRIIKAWNEDLRLTALKLEKDVESEDLAKKRVMISDAQHEYRNYLNELYLGTKPIEIVLNHPDFALAIKGKSKFTAMQDAINTMLANAKIEADKVTQMLRTKLDWMNVNANAFSFLFNDLQTIIYKPMDDFQLLVNSRVEQHMKVTAEREAKIKADAEAAALAKIEANKAPVENHIEETLTMVESKIEVLREAVVEHQDEILSFFKSRDFSTSKENEYRAVIVEFIKHQEATKLKLAA